MPNVPLKITFYLSGGWVPPPYPLHLDALLAHNVTQRGLRDLEDDPSIEALRALGEDLPLSRHEQGGEWVWKASALELAQPIFNDSRFYTQRRDKQDYALGVAEGSILHGRHQPGAAMKPYQFQIDTLRGVHRNLLGFYPVQRPFAATALLEVVAYCVGDKDRLEELLTDERCPTHIGARRRSGHGKIERVEIVVDQAALDAWKRRVRPWAFDETDTAIQAAWRAPYWLAENRGAAYCPAGL